MTLSTEELRETARDIYIYAYPLLISQVTRNVACNVAEPIGLRAPINQIAHNREFPDATYTDVVRPNADTLYSALSFDVSKEPLVITIPDSGGRYYLTPWLDWWTDVFAVPGSRTTGNDAITYAIVGPKWQGSLPDGVKEYRSPTAYGALIGRTQTNGKADYEAVRAFQDGIKVMPLSAYGQPYTPPKHTVNPNQDMSAPPDQVEQMDAETFFTLFIELMQDNPPHANDYPILDRMQRMGIEPGKPFTFADVSPEVQDALRAAPAAAIPLIKQVWANSGAFANGWRTNMTAIGTYGTDYLHRAGVAYAGYGANVIEDAIYPTVFTDTEGEPLSSERRYMLHFEADQIPPVRAFWSLTMYDERQLFAANPIDRYALGDRDPLAYNPNGSLDLYIQRQSPGPEREANWLPTPEQGNFTMNLRLYWPKADALNGAWVPPGVKRV